MGATICKKTAEQDFACGLTKVSHLEFGMLVYSQANDIIGVFQIKCLLSIGCTQHDPSPRSVVHNVTIWQIVEVVPGVKSPVAVYKVQTELLQVKRLL